MKIREDFVTNSSSSSFICIKCKDEVECYDWESQWERSMCNSCYNDLTQEDQIKVDQGEYVVDDNKEINKFLDFLCDELYLDRERIMNKYRSWKENNED